MDEQNYPSKLYSSGEFARLSGINKSTLLYYDRIGLLTPAHIDDNGYRYYTSGQLFGPYIIGFYQNIGKSLDYIKDYMDNRVPEHFVSITGGIIEELEEQKRVIQNRINVLAQLTRIIQRASADVPNVPTIYDDVDDYRLITTPIESKKPTFSENYNDAFLRHHSFCTKELKISQYPLGYIADMTPVKIGTKGVGMSFATLLCDDGVEYPPDRMVFRPKGRFVRMLHKGSYTGLATACRKLLAYMEQQGLMPQSNIYILETNTFLTGSDSSQYTFSITIRIN